MPIGMLPIIVGSVVALGCLVAAFRSLRHKRLIDDLPTSKTQGVFIGLAELKGTAESDAPLTSHLASVKCVHYQWQVDEHWSRIVHETFTDAKGHVQTRTRTESGWSKVAGDTQSIPFYLKDDSGVIRVQPEGATLQDTSIFNETCTPGNPLYFGKAPVKEIANSDHRRRFTESAIPLHARLYIMGQARERQDVVAAEIAHDKSAPMFLISMQSERQISSRYGFWLWFFVVLGLLVSVGAAITWQFLGRITPQVSWQPYVIAAVGFLVALDLGWVWTVYNSFINLHHRVEQGWSQVDVQLKRRHDLIPRLTQVIAGYQKYEKETQNVLAELRAQAEATPPGVAGPDFNGVAPLLRIVSERYPELKASEIFLKLQAELVDTEQRIALARDYFNEIATFYNTRLQVIPDRFVGVLARMKMQPLLEAQNFERVPIQVSLAA